MILLPTFRRPHNLKRFVQAYMATGASLPIHVVFDAADAARYNEVQTPPHWTRCAVPAGTPIGEIFNIIFKKFPNEDYYGMVADDVVPETAMWDIILRDSCQPDKIAWGADGVQNEALPLHPFIGGDLVRRLGWWSAPGLKHWYVDNVWKNLANALDCGVYLPQVKMTHYHPVSGLAQSDRTYEEQPDHGADERAYYAFMHGGFQEAIRRK